LGTDIDKVKPRDGIFTCVQICVEVSLEKGIPEEIQLSLDDWKHIQPVNCEQLMFKCNKCHEYGQLFQTFPKKCSNIEKAPRK